MVQRVLHHNVFGQFDHISFFDALGYRKTYYILFLHFDRSFVHRDTVFGYAIVHGAAHLQVANGQLRALPAQVVAHVIDQGVPFIGIFPSAQEG